MKTLGDHQTARRLYDAFSNEHRTPEGFSMLGSGCFRTAFLHEESQLVYKVGSYESNLSDSQVSRVLRKKPTSMLAFPIYIPRARTYRMPDYKSGRGVNYPSVVCVQEYAQDAEFTHCSAVDASWDDDAVCTCMRDLCHATVLEELAAWSGLGDMHGENVLLDPSERYWIIDFGC